MSILFTARLIFCCSLAVASGALTLGTRNHFANYRFYTGLADSYACLSAWDGSCAISGDFDLRLWRLTLPEVHGSFVHESQQVCHSSYYGGEPASSGFGCKAITYPYGMYVWISIPFWFLTTIWIVVSCALCMIAGPLRVRLIDVFVWFTVTQVMIILMSHIGPGPIVVFVLLGSLAAWMYLIYRITYFGGTRLLQRYSASE